MKKLITSLALIFYAALASSQVATPKNWNSKGTFWNTIYIRGAAQFGTGAHTGYHMICADDSGLMVWQADTSVFLPNSQIGIGSASNNLVGDTNFHYYADRGLFLIGHDPDVIADTSYFYFSLTNYTFQAGCLNGAIGDVNAKGNNTSISWQDGTKTFFFNGYTNIVLGGLNYIPPTSEAPGTILGNDGSGGLSWIPGVNGFVYDTVAIVSGTATLTRSKTNVIVAAGAITSATLTLPSSPANNDIVSISFTQTIATLNYSGGTVVGAVTTSVPVGSVGFRYSADRNIWVIAAL